MSNDKNEKKNQSWMNFIFYFSIFSIVIGWGMTIVKSIINTRDRPFIFEIIVKHLYGS